MESHSLKQWFLVTCTRLDWLSNLGKGKNFPLGSPGNYFSVVFALPWSMKPISFLGSGEFTQHDQFPVTVCCCHCGEGKAALLDHFDTKSCHLEIDQDVTLWASNENHKEIQRLMKSWREWGLYIVSYYWLKSPLFPLMSQGARYLVSSIVYHASRVFCQDLKSNTTGQTQWGWWVNSPWCRISPDRDGGAEEGCVFTVWRSHACAPWAGSDRDP